MPGTMCSIAVCRSNVILSKKLGDQVRFFNFPKNPNLRKEWVRKCFQTDNFNPVNKRICSKHFQFDDYEDAVEAMIQNRLPKILKRNCVPSLNLKLETNLSSAKKARLERAAKKKQKEIIKKIMENENNKDVSETCDGTSDNQQSTLNGKISENGSFNNVNDGVQVTIKQEVEDPHPLSTNTIDSDTIKKERSLFLCRRLEKKISELLSTQVQVLVAEVQYEDS